MDDTTTMCYAARYPGKPGYGFITVDKPEYAKETAKDVAKMIKQGAVIERVTVEQAKAGMLEYLDARRS